MLGGATSDAESFLPGRSAYAYPRINMGEDAENLYVEAARVNGCSGLRIAAFHILPNVATPILVLSTTAVGWAVVIGATINFLNLGVQAPTPSWGSILSTGRNYMAIAWWIATLPGICLFLLVLSVNMIGDYLRDHFDPRSLRR